MLGRQGRVAGKKRKLARLTSKVSVTAFAIRLQPPQPSCEGGTMSGGADAAARQQEEKRERELDRALSSLEAMAEGVIGTLNEIHDLTEKFSYPTDTTTASDQQRIHHKIGTLVSQYREMHELPIPGAGGETGEDVQAPRRVLDLIDQGKNPDLYWKEVVESTTKTAAEQKGKVQALHGLRSALKEKYGTAAAAAGVGGDDGAGS